MRKTTKIHHPVLKQESTVDERSLHVWETSGWVRGPLETADTSAAEAREQPAGEVEEPVADEPVAEEASAAPNPRRTAKPKTPADSPATPDA